MAWIILFGDAFHKFIDGVSVGAAFTESFFAGISVALAVICEEIPHELGRVIFAYYMYMYIPPYTSLLYSKTRVYRGIHIFLIFAPKHRLWVHVRTASSNVLSMNIKNITQN